MMSTKGKYGARLIGLTALVMTVAGCGHAGPGPRAIAQRPAAAGKAADFAAQAEKAHRKGDLGAVLVYRRSAALAAPEDAHLRVGLAQAYLAVGRNGAASATFRDAIEMAGRTDEAVRGLASAQLALGRVDTAREMLASLRPEGRTIALTDAPAGTAGMSY